MMVIPMMVIPMMVIPMMVIPMMVIPMMVIPMTVIPMMVILIETVFQRYSLEMKIQFPQLKTFQVCACFKRCTFFDKNAGRERRQGFQGSC